MMDSCGTDNPAKCGTFVRDSCPGHPSSDHRRRQIWREIPGGPRRLLEPI